MKNRTTAEVQTAEVQDYVAASGDRPGVIIMVTHQVNITALSGVFPRSGSAVIWIEVVEACCPIEKSPLRSPDYADLVTTSIPAVIPTFWTDVLGVQRNR